MLNKISEINYTRIEFLITISFALIAFFCFGAVFWYDSIAYVDLGNHIFNLGGLKSYYDSNSRNLFQHLGFGYPLVWGALHTLFNDYSWKVLSVLQHTLSAMSLVYLSGSFSAILPKKMRIIAILIICTSGFYQSFHNSIMAESFSLTILNLGVGSMMRLNSKLEGRKHWCVFLICILLAPHFKMSTFVVLISFLPILFLQNRITLKRSILIFVGCVFSVFLPIAIRFFYTGLLIIPNSDHSLPYLAGRINPAPSAELLNWIRKIPHPSSIDLANDGYFKLRYSDFSVTWDKYLKEKGLSSTERLQFFRDLASRVKWDSNNSIINQFIQPMTSLGFIHIPFAPKNHNIGYEITTSEYLAHNRQHYEWLSWKSSGYPKMFSNFISRYYLEKKGIYQESSIEILNNSIKPFIKDRLSLRGLFISDKIPLDVFGLSFILICFLFWTIYRPYCYIFSAIIVSQWLLFAKIGFGNVRYFYSLYPLAIFLSVVLAWYAYNYGKTLMRKRYPNFLNSFTNVLR
jgi:hypothetical protein